MSEESIDYVVGLVRHRPPCVGELRRIIRQRGVVTLYRKHDGVPFLSAVMIEACNEADVTALVTLLDAGLSCNAALGESSGYTLLMRAASSNARVVRLLLDAGADPNYRDHRGWTALMFAVALDETSCDVSESKSIVTQLLLAGADRSVRNDRGQTAMNILFEQKSAEPADVQELVAVL